MPDIRMPDGVVVRFPDDMSRDQIRTMIMRKYPEAAKPQEAAPPSPQMQQNLAELSAMTQNPASGQFDALPGWQKPLVAANDMLALGVKGATFGFGDKAVAAIRAPFTDNTYAEELEGQRAKTEGSRNRAGNAGVVAEIGGAVATPMGLARRGLTLAGRGGTAAMTGAKGLAARTGLMGVEGAGYGSLTALGNDMPVGEGAALGALGGAGGSAIGEGMSAAGSKVFGAFNRKPNIPTNENLRKLAQQAYDKAENAGLVFKPAGVQRVANDIRVELANEGFLPRLQPRIAAFLDELERVQNGNITLKGMDVLRRVASNARMSADPTEQRLGGQIIAKLDDFIENVDPKDVLMGDAQAGSAALKQGRELWRRVKKSELVDTQAIKAERRAASTGAGGNLENATRQNIRQIMDNSKKSAGFTPDEKAAMDRVVRGTKGQNAMRMAGKLAPTGIVSAALSGGAGYGLLGPVGLALPLAGAGAKALAERGTMNSLDDLSRIVRAGGQASAARPAPNALQRLSKAERDRLARILMAVGVHQSVAP